MQGKCFQQAAGGKVSRAIAIGLVGHKDGKFTRDMPVGPKAEPWFFIRCWFDAGGSTLCYTKDAKFYIPLWYDHVEEWRYEEHIIVKEAIERYVAEVEN